MKRPKTRTRCAHCKRKREPGSWSGATRVMSGNAPILKLHSRDAAHPRAIGGRLRRVKVTVIATSRDILDKVFARLAHHFRHP